MTTLVHWGDRVSKYYTWEFTLTWIIYSHQQPNETKLQSSLKSHRNVPSCILNETAAAAPLFTLCLWPEHQCLYSTYNSSHLLFHIYLNLNLFIICLTIKHSEYFLCGCWMVAIWTSKSWLGDEKATSSPHIKPVRVCSCETTETILTHIGPSLIVR